jgi:hypothetical protein
MIKNLIIVFLTLTTFSCILIIRSKRHKNFYSRSVYKQSDMHNMLKYFFEQKTQLNNIKQSQSKKFKNDKEIKAIIIKGKAYWVKDNIFYTAETNNNDIMLETAKPINTDNMSEIEINKMLFILDSLKNGGYGNDSGSARN